MEGIKITRKFVALKTKYLLIKKAQRLEVNGLWYLLFRRYSFSLVLSIRVVNTSNQGKDFNTVLYALEVNIENNSHYYKSFK